MSPSDDDSELWAVIKDFPEYVVSTHGRIQNLMHGSFVKPRRDTYGNARVMLKGEDGVYRNRLVRRLVAEAFLTGFVPSVRLKNVDNDRMNNHLKNIDFYRQRRMGTITRKPMRGQIRRVKIVQTDQSFSNVHSLADYLSCHPSNIYKVLRGERPHYKGLTFEYFFVEL